MEASVSLLQHCDICGYEDSADNVNKHIQLEHAGQFSDEEPSRASATMGSGELQTSDPISQAIGDFGRWQFMLTFLLSLFNFPCTFHIFAPTFQAETRDYWCARPSFFQDLPVDEWKNISGALTLKNGELVYDPCMVRDIVWSNSGIRKYNITGDLKPCTRWEYDVSAFGDTIISEWDLVCDNSQWVSIAEMMFLGGVALGGICSGLLSDRYGRKKALMIALSWQITLGTLIALAPSIGAFMVLRAILGFVCVSVVFSGFVLCVELVGGKWLTISGVSYLFPLPFSYIVTSGIAYFIHGWRNLQLAITLSALPFIVLWWVLPESPRWLHTMGKIDKTLEVLEDAAAFNKISLPQNIDKILKQTSNAEATGDGPKMGLADLFRTPTIRKISLALYVVWFSVYLVYYGLVLNLSNLGGDVYINSIISGAVEFPAILISIFILLKLGRRWPLSLSLIAAGIACLLTMPVPQDLSWVTICLAMVGKFAISSSNVVMPVYTAELFPTVMRNLGVGSSNVPAGIALMLVPYLWNLSGMYTTLPMAVLGVCGIVGGVAVLILPETNDAGLTDTVEAVEEQTREKI